MAGVGTGTGAGVGIGAGAGVFGVAGAVVNTATPLRASCLTKSVFSMSMAIGMFRPGGETTILSPSKRITSTGSPASKTTSEGEISFCVTAVVGGVGLRSFLGFLDFQEGTDGRSPDQITEDPGEGDDAGSEGRFHGEWGRSWVCR